ncbi:formylglycine-generating enzyme family protein [Leptolyngbyaceae cyanobacterium UHCC 1019]
MTTEDLGNDVPLEMVVIPGGEFLMGISDSQRETILKEYLKTASQENAEKWTSWKLPQHKVVIPAFCMGKYPVTQKQWLAVMGEFKQEPSFLGDQRPIERVSWDDAIAFCSQLSQKTGKPYRLPSEAEWEYACRAGTTTPFSFGDTITPDLANYNSNYTYGEGAKGACQEQTTDVGSFPANVFGLYDMHGNVWEWCADQWYDSYTNKPESLKQNGAIAWTAENTKISPKPDVAELRLLRGGSWYDNPRHCRSANRNWHGRDYRGFNFGFRLVCAVPRTL